MNTLWRRTKKKVKKIDKMNAVGECDASIGAWTLEAAETRPQRLDPAESPIGNRVAHP